MGTLGIYNIPGQFHSYSKSFLIALKLSPNHSLEAAWLPWHGRANGYFLFAFSMPLESSQTFVSSCSDRCPSVVFHMGVTPRFYQYFLYYLPFFCILSKMREQGCNIQVWHAFRVAKKKMSSWRGHFQTGRCKSMQQGRSTDHWLTKPWRTSL